MSPMFESYKALGQSIMELVIENDDLRTRVAQLEALLVDDGK